MILSAKESGADYVKFQLYASGSRILKTSRNKYDYEDNIGEENSICDILERSRLKPDDIIELNDFCDSSSIPLFFTVFDLESLNLVLDLKHSLIKVASMDLNNLWLHDMIASKFEGTVIISTGMSTFPEICAAVKRYSDSGCKLVVMHCTSSYPAPDSSLNIAQIKLLNETFGSFADVGFSDHSPDILASTMSSVYGINWIERHFTTDRTLPGPDNKISLLPHEFFQLRQNISRIPIIIGSESVCTKIQASELTTYTQQKKSLHYKHDFSVGHVLCADDFIFCAPATGLSQNEFENCSSKVLIKSVKAFTPLSNEHLSTSSLS